MRLTEMVVNEFPGRLVARKSSEFGAGPTEQTMPVPGPLVIRGTDPIGLDTITASYVRGDAIADGVPIHDILKSGIVHGQPRQVVSTHTLGARCRARQPVSLLAVLR